MGLWWDELEDSRAYCIWIINTGFQQWQSTVLTPTTWLPLQNYLKPVKNGVPKLAQIPLARMHFAKNARMRMTPEIFITANDSNILNQIPERKLPEYLSGEKD